MRFTNTESKDTRRKRVVYEDNDVAGPSRWLNDVRLVAMQGYWVEVEPPSLPMVCLARALSYHLRQIGVLDLYDPESNSNGQGADYVCKFCMALELENQAFDVSVELFYKFRYPGDVESHKRLTHVDVCDWLFERIVNDVNILPRIEMRMRHILLLEHATCYINGLEVTL